VIVVILGMVLYVLQILQLDDDEVVEVEVEHLLL